MGTLGSQPAHNGARRLLLIVLLLASEVLELRAVQQRHPAPHMGATAPQVDARQGCPNRSTPSPPSFSPSCRTGEVGGKQVVPAQPAEHRRALGAQAALHGKQGPRGAVQGSSQT